MLQLIAAATLHWWQPTIIYDIPETDAASAVSMWVLQSGTDTAGAMYFTKPLRRIRANPVKCTCTPRDALDLLLKGTKVLVVDMRPDTPTPVEESEEPFVWIWWEKPSHCRPELAERAPLPPCLPRPLVIKPSPEEHTSWK